MEEIEFAVFLDENQHYYYTHKDVTSRTFTNPFLMFAEIAKKVEDNGLSSLIDSEFLTLKGKVTSVSKARTLKGACLTIEITNAPPFKVMIETDDKMADKENNVKWRPRQKVELVGELTEILVGVPNQPVFLKMRGSVCP